MTATEAFVVVFGGIALGAVFSLAWVGIVNLLGRWARR